MKNGNNIKVFLVDADAHYLGALEMYFNHHGFIIEMYVTAEHCIENLSHHPDLIILDYHLDGIDKKTMNGIEALDKIKQFNEDIPVIMLSSIDEIEVAINCIHHKASDYIVKSETAFVRLQKSVTDVFHYKKLEKTVSWFEERL